MTWALALTTSLEVSTPRASRPSISWNSTARSMTTPLPITGVHVGVRMPEGRRWSANFSRLPSFSMTMVCPALLPPLNFTT